MFETFINFEFKGEPPYEFQKIGYYFKSENHIAKHFVIEVDVKENEFNSIVKLSEIPIPENEIKIGSKIALCDYELDFICEIDLRNKYFFPKFNNEMQLYYDNCDRWKADAINYGIKKGLEIGNIKTY